MGRIKRKGVLSILVLCLMLVFAGGSPRRVEAASKRAWAKIGTKCYNGKGKVIPGAFLRGIDVSEWQGSINWNKVAKSNVDFAFIRAYYGANYLDKYFHANMSGAQDAGIPAGVYIYSLATSYSEVLKETQTVIQAMNGHLVSYPVVYDLEASSLGKLSKEKIGKMAQVFCKEIADAGYTPMVYCNQTWYLGHIDWSYIEDVEVWLASYNDALKGPDKSQFRYGIWQATDGDTVPGHVSTRGLIDGITPGDNVDINFGYVDYTTIVTPRTTPKLGYTPAKKPMYPDDGWVTGSDGAVRYYQDGEYVTGWKKISGKWYYFSKKGVCSTSKLIKGVNTKYYVGSDGARVTSQMVTVGGKTYYFGKNGKATKGKVLLNGKYYYFDKTSFAMCKRKKIVEGKKVYYASTSGALVTSSFKTLGASKGGSVYYFGSDGAALLGLQKIGGKTYYFYTTKAKLGVRAENTTVVSSYGTAYEFGPDGVLLRRYKKTA